MRFLYRSTKGMLHNESALLIWIAGVVIFGLIAVFDGGSRDEGAAESPAATSPAPHTETTPDG